MTTLELFDSSEIRRVLCVVAHPDDMEYGGAAGVPLALPVHAYRMS